MLALRPASINRALISLKRFFATEVEEGRMQRDPAKHVSRLQAVGPPRRFLSDREEDALVAAVSHHGTPRDRTIVVLLLHTGLRSRELCQLQAQQVHVGTRSGTLDVIGKEGKRRRVPLNATARSTLAEYLPMLGSGSAPLFPSTKTGKALSQRALGHLMQRYAALARLPRVRPHDLRHRFGYRMALSTPLQHVAQLMGHASLETTRVYARGGKVDLQREVVKFATR